MTPTEATTFAELAKRVAALERARAQDNHRHNYRYSKHMTQHSFTGWDTFWSWTCRDEDGEIDRTCPQPSGGTNHRTGLPDHFPDQLR